MYKKTLFTTLVLTAILFSQMTGRCYADVAAQLEKAKSYLQNGYYQQAEALYNSVITENPNTDYALEAQKDLVFLYIKMQKKVGTSTDPQLPLNTLKSAYSANPLLPKALYDIAAEYEKKRKYDKAKSIYQDIIQQHSGSSYADKAQLDIPKIEILSLIQSRQDTAAQTAIDNFISRYSSNSYVVAALNDIAYQWRKFKNFPKAIGLYQYIANTWPTASDAMWAQMGVAKSNVEAGDYTAAGPALNKLITNYASHPDLPTAMHYIARSYRKAKKYQEAKSLYQQIIQKYPGSSFASNAQIEIAKMDILAYIKAGDYAVADTATNNLISNFSGNLRLSLALNQIAWIYEHAGEYERAKNIYQQIAQTFADNFRGSQVQLDKAKCQIYLLINSRDDNAAIGAVNTLISDFKNHSYLPFVVTEIANKYYHKAWESERQYDPVQAGIYFEKAVIVYEKVINDLAFSETSPQACSSAGSCYRKLGKYQESNRCYQRIIDNYPLYGEAWNALFMIGDNYQKMAKAKLISGSLARAQTGAAYRQLLEKYPGCKAAKAASSWLKRHKF